MAVQRGQLITAAVCPHVDDHTETVATVIPGDGHSAVSGRQDWGAIAHSHVNALMVRPFARNRVDTSSKGTADIKGLRVIR
ncbi:hypothetical protein SDC9_147645 [bioreactor metagenome]|uniref:Uncharacterized protein n=1 Tax=bioreactor metagenome TaxID=1076179 RepID=A0A645EGK7_9ZZZZ